MSKGNQKGVQAMFTIRIKAAGNPTPTLIEGTYDRVMAFAHALEVFPSDVVSVEVWNTDTMETTYKWESAEWAE